MSRLTSRGIQIDRISLPRLAWLLVAVVMFWHLLYITCSVQNRDKIIGSDGAGYYAYLPAVFVYHDYQYKFTIAGEPTKANYFSADHTMFLNKTIDGKWINKYFIGTAIAQLPFFLVPYATAPVFGYGADGYSFPFQVSIALAAIFYTLLGLEQIRRLLDKKGIKEHIQALVILLLFFGTNLYHYALNEPSMSHAFSFGFVALFLNQSYNIFHQKNRRAIVWSILLLTMIIFIRPVNGVVLFTLPFIAGSWKNFLDGVKFTFSEYKMLLIGIAGFAVVLFLQLLMYKLSVGDWIADSYSGEHYDITNAHIGKVLFSWRKGWFIYTPMMILAVSGFFFLRSHFERFAFLAFLMLNIWVVSSWQTWEYGGSLGMRPMVDTYSVMAIPFAFLLESLLKRWKLLIMVPVLSFLVLLNLVQTYQYKYAILAYDGMTYEGYKKIFFKTDLLYSCIYDPWTRWQHTLPDNTKKISSFIRTFEEDTSYGRISYWSITNEKAFAGKNAVKLDTGTTTAGLCVPYHDALPDSLYSKAWVVVRAKVFLVDEQLMPKMGVSFRNEGKEYHLEAHPLYFEVNEIGSWQDFVFAVRFPVPPTPGGEVCCFLLHGDHSVAYADNMQIEFWAEQ